MTPYKQTNKLQLWPFELLVAIDFFDCIYCQIVEQSRSDLLFFLLVTYFFSLLFVGSMFIRLNVHLMVDLKFRNHNNKSMYVRLFADQSFVHEKWTAL